MKTPETAFGETTRRTESLWKATARSSPGLDNAPDDGAMSRRATLEHSTERFESEVVEREESSSED